ncbi:cytochrome P450 [Neolewinella xylanilytica]|uniref:Cytochrome P450 n=1 Tax=Neolewinella xylanilytica TaxID=1514080 RepID=A0A2S6I5Y1_9BACT|nr:cytochrome P450 [Neolewinella xylanilytica]PPK86539.1 cytochrome P450 [Neolewinella xylanilytica]
MSPDTSPPRIPRLTVLRNLLRLARHPIPTFQRFIGRYGDNFILSVDKSRTTHFTVSPDVVQHVMQRNHRNYEKSEVQTHEMARYLGYGLLTNSGADWLRQRRLIQPGFHRQRMEKLSAEMQRVIAAECEQAARNKTTDLFSFTRNTAYRIIVSAIFTDDFGDAETATFQSILDRLQAYIINPIRLPFLRKPLRWLGIEERHLALAETSRTMLLRHIRHRRAQTGKTYDDLLQMLLDARYEDTGEGMTDEQLVDEVLILFAAGYETSANALAWTVWLLLKHPAELAKVQKELVQLGSPADYGNVARLPYLTQVIRESLRLYPPAWITDRIARGEDEVQGLTIPAGTTVGIFIYGIHRSPHLYADPDAFRPDRMQEDLIKARHPFAYLPFGGGPRLCIGHHFALLEMQLFLAHLLGFFRVSAAGSLPALRPVPYITLHQDQPVVVQVTRS